MRRAAFGIFVHIFCSLRFVVLFSFGNQNGNTDGRRTAELIECSRTSHRFDATRPKDRSFNDFLTMTIFL